MKIDPLLITQALGDYENKGGADLLEYAELCIGEQNLRKICVRLLSWLTGGMNYPGMANRRPPVKLRIMRLHEFGSSQQAFIDLIRQESPFAVLFEIGPEGVSLHHQIDMETQNKIREKARQINPFIFLDSKN
jgi:hypothetical protein